MTAADLGELADTYPEWEFGTSWTAAATGPDYRRVWAHHGEQTIRARTATELARKLLDRAAPPGRPRAGPSGA